jgi:hypothetical protein
MSTWFERYQRRKRELAQGVDADLVRSNRRRYKLAFVLLGAGFLLAPVTMTLNPEGISHQIGFVLAMLLIISGLATGRWASAESAFLSKPDPEYPPRIFRK